MRVRVNLSGLIPTTHLGLGPALKVWGLTCVDSVIQMSIGEAPQAQGRCGSIYVGESGDWLGIALFPGLIVSGNYYRYTSQFHGF
ncbi:hypothetical protein P4S72_27650 [Vibrio sp. PP-XX7]